MEISKSNYGYFIDVVTLFDNKQKNLAFQPPQMHSYRIMQKMGFSNLKSLFDAGLKYKYLNQLEDHFDIKVKDLVINGR